MTNRNVVQEYEPEVKDSDILASIREWEGTNPPSKPYQDAPQQQQQVQPQGQQGNAQATATSPEIEATVNRLLEARLSAAMDQRLGDLNDKLSRLENIVTTSNTRGNDVPQWVTDGMNAIAKEVRDMRYDNIMDPDEKVAFLEKEREAAIAYEATLKQQQEADQQRTDLLQSDQRSYEDQVKQQNFGFFNGTLLKHLVDVAATYGISEEEATRDAKATIVEPTTDARTGWLNGYNWDKFQDGLNDKWKDLSSRRDSGRERGRTGGDPGRAAQGATSFDPWDKRYQENGGSLSDMVLAAVRMNQ